MIVTITGGKQTDANGIESSCFDTGGFGNDASSPTDLCSSKVPIRKFPISSLLHNILQYTHYFMADRNGTRSSIKRLLKHCKPLPHRSPLRLSPLRSLLLPLGFNTAVGNVSTTVTNKYTVGTVTINTNNDNTSTNNNNNNDDNGVNGYGNIITNKEWAKMLPSDPATSSSSSSCYSVAPFPSAGIHVALEVADRPNQASTGVWHNVTGTGVTESPCSNIINNNNNNNGGGVGGVGYNAGEDSLLSLSTADACSDGTGAYAIGEDDNNDSGDEDEEEEEEAEEEEDSDEEQEEDDHDLVVDTGGTTAVGAKKKKKKNWREEQQEDCSFNKTVRAVLRQLHRHKVIDTLENVLISKKPDSVCVLIPRPVQYPHVNPVQQRNESPHFLVCKLFRWPQLTNAQHIRSTRDCERPLDHTVQPQLCINPYHYERIRKRSVMRPVLVPQYRRREAQDNQRAGDSGIEAEKMSPASSSGSVSMSPERRRNIVDRWNGKSARNTIGEQSDAMNTSGGEELENDNCEEFQQPIDFALVPYAELSHWCSISYYEMKQRVGEQYEAVGTMITIDGFTDPSSSKRFCLGLLSNVNRTVETEAIRRHIGRGVRLHYTGGEVFAECLSKNPVFVQSPNCNARYGWHPATVCKIPPGCNLKIFANGEFADVLHASVPQGYETVFQLQRMCIIRMSFVKGWGREYRRQTITSTPCWVEIHLCNPLRWLDAVLQRMSGPDFTIHSNT